MTPQEAWTIVGGLSKPSKMPCHGYSLPTKHCSVGSKLSDVPGSVCYKCYAERGNYLYSNVQNALDRRFQSLSDPRWIDAMTLCIKHNEGSGYFRWHDSGDLQGIWHLAMIVEVCNRTPDIKHWLPTREYSTVRQYRQEHQFPANLTVRLSAYMIDGPAPERQAGEMGVQTSTVVKTGEATCPAPTQGNKCLACRKCWNSSITNIAYKYH